MAPRCYQAERIQASPHQVLEGGAAPARPGEGHEAAGAWKVREHIHRRPGLSLHLESQPGFLRRRIPLPDCYGPALSWHACVRGGHRRRMHVHRRRRRPRQWPPFFAHMAGATGPGHFCIVLTPPPVPVF